MDTYQNYFDENGKFKANLFNQDLPKDEYEIVEESSQAEEEDNPEPLKYDHIRTPNFTIVLNSAYEDNLEGVHLMNKYQQKFAMDEFVSGKMAAGEMGNGIKLQDMIHEEKLRMDLIYYDHAFNQYVSDLIPTNRSLPDRRDEWCKKPSSFYTTSGEGGGREGGRGVVNRGFISNYPTQINCRQPR